MSSELEDGHWFKSTLFEVELREDKNTNPFCYGKQLSNWVRDQFIDLGYSVEEVIEEDWGFCVMCQREPYSLWIGCGNMRSDLYETVNEEEYKNFIPESNSLTWYCFPTVEVPFFKRMFGKTDTTQGFNKLKSELKTILSNEKEIIFVEQP
jgi:hypothetical protein